MALISLPSCIPRDRTKDDVILLNLVSIILIEEYLRYKKPKSPYNFFLILIINKLFKFKFRTNGNVERQRALLWTLRATIFRLRSHKDHFSFFIALPHCSDQKIRMKCYLILRKLHWTRKIFLKIILSPCKIYLLI